MSRVAVALSVLALPLLDACSTPARQDTAAETPWITHGSLLVGPRRFSDGDLRDLDLDSPVAYGVEVDSYASSSGTGFEAGYLHSHADSSFFGDSIEFSVSEFYAGIRQTFMLQQKFHPYAGVGISEMFAHENIGDTGNAVDIAPYVHAGILWDVAERLRLGLDCRFAWASFDAVNGDYRQLALSIGWRF